MNQFRAILAVITLLLALPAWSSASERPKYSLRYSVEFRPESGSAAVEIRTQRDTGRLVALDLAMPADVYSQVSGDGSVVHNGERVTWTPPKEGGALRYSVVIDHQRADGAFDARMTPDWVIVRGDRLFPPAKVRATKNSVSRAQLHVKLPKGWDDVETPFTKITGGDFAVANPTRKFDRPVGWIAAGKLTSSRETIFDCKVTLTAPKGERSDKVAAIAMMREALPVMLQAFEKLPDKLLIVRSGDPMWRGGLSAPGSLWLHADRPLLSENGTSPLLHELTHVITGVRGGPKDDWIAEGLAEFYSLEIGRRAGLISAARFARSIKMATRLGEKVETLRATQSQRDRTRKAVALFAALDTELRANGSNIDALTRLLMRREVVTLEQLRIDAKKLQGKPSALLASVK